MGIVSIFIFSFLFQIFIFVIPPWVDSLWNFMCMSVHYPLGNQTAATEKESVSINWQKWEKANGGGIFSSILQCWWRRRKSFVVCLKGPAEKVGMHLS